MTRRRRPTDTSAGRTGDRYVDDDPDGERARVKLSKKLSLYLRHAPEKIGLELDEGGWVDVDVLRAGMATAGRPVTEAELRDLVLWSDKQRFALSEDGRRIRANQGHSVEVDLGLATSVPPDVLFHGTVDRFLAAIRAEGLQPGSRHDVHLSATREAAEEVGRRRGEPVALVVDAAGMVAAGHAFRVSENGVWLTPAVPPEFLAET